MDDFGMVHPRSRPLATRPALFFFLAIASAQFAGCRSAEPALLVNIVDPLDINAISKFHSCAGHAYPAQDSPNSGKIYFWPNSTNQSTTNGLKEYAVCTGTAVQLPDDLDINETARGESLHLFCDNSTTVLRYFHVNFDHSILGAHVDAGEPVGYAALVNIDGGPAQEWQYSSNFDLGVSDDNTSGGVVIDNGVDGPSEDYFARLTPAAFTAWSVRGLTSVSQTINPGDPTCTSYSSNIGSADIVVLNPLR